MTMEAFFLHQTLHTNSKHELTVNKEQVRMNELCDSIGKNRYSMQRKALHGRKNFSL